MIGIGITLLGRRGASGPNGLPSGLTVVSVSTTQLQIYWLDGATDADLFSLERTSVAGGLSGFTEIATILPGVEYKADTTCSEATTYYYRIRALKGTVYSAYSNIASAATSNSAIIAKWNFDNKDSFYDQLQDLPFHPIHSQSAQYFNGKTYIAFSGNDCDPYIMTYTHATAAWSAPVKIGTNPLLNTNLGHGEPSMLIDATGYIHVMYGAHTTTLKYAKSNAAENITAWTAMTDPAAKATYPQLIQFTDGTIYCFFRKTGIEASPKDDWGYITSTDGGANWSAYTSICTYYAYLKFQKGTGDFVHVSMNGYEVTGYARFDAYYICFDGTDWKNIAGTTLTLPLDATDALDILVKSSGTNYIPLTTVTFDSSNNPFILFTESTDASDVSTFNYKLAKYVSGAWSIINLGISTDKYEDTYPAIEHVGGNNLVAYLTAWGIKDSLYGNLQKWTSADNGSTWSFSETILQGQVGWPVIVKDHHSDAKIVTSNYRSGATTSWLTEGYLWGDSGFIRNPAFTRIVDTSKTYPIIPSGTINQITGKYGQCLQFTGSPNHCYLTDDDIFSFAGGSPDKPFSVALWAYLTATTGNQMLIGKSETAKREWWLFVGTNVLYFICSSLNGTNFIYATVAFTTINDWVHICGTYTGSGNQTGLKIYLNAIESQTAQSQSGTYVGMANGTAQVYIGRRNANADADYYLTGRVDELKIFNKALSQPEVALSMNNHLAW